MQAREIARLLVEWYRANKRELPWRDQKRWSQAAYAVRCDVDHRAGIDVGEGLGIGDHAAADSSADCDPVLPALDGEVRLATLSSELPALSFLSLSPPYS
eukprot:756437-Hanusia_phi.AAC.1